MKNKNKIKLKNQFITKKINNVYYKIYTNKRNKDNAKRGVSPLA